MERSPYDRYTVWVRGKDGFPHEASFESDETCALAITSRVDRLSYHGAVPKTFPPMTRDLEHPYLLGGLAAFFFVSGRHATHTERCRSGFRIA